MSESHCSLLLQTSSLLQDTEPTLAVLSAAVYTKRVIFVAHAVPRRCLWLSAMCRCSSEVSLAPSPRSGLTLGSHTPQCTYGVFTALFCTQEQWLRGGSQALLLGQGLPCRAQAPPLKEGYCPKKLTPYASRNWARGRMPVPRSQTLRSMLPVQNCSRNKTLGWTPADCPLSHPLLLRSCQQPCRNASEEPLVPEVPWPAAQPCRGSAGEPRASLPVQGRFCKPNPRSRAAAAIKIPGEQHASEQVFQTPRRLEIGNRLILIFPTLMASDLY